MTADTIFDVGEATSTDENGIKSFADQNVYAQWSANNYAVYYTFKDNHDNLVSEVVNNNPSTFSFDDTDEQLTLSAPSKAGYTFSKWFLVKDGGETEEITKIPKTVGTKSLLATFTRNHHTVTFNYKGGTDGDSKSTSDREVYEYSAYNKVVGTAGAEDDKPLPVVTKKGYTFVEWNTAEDGTGSTVNSATVMATSDATVYAVWSKDTYTVTYEYEYKDDHAPVALTGVTNTNDTTYSVTDANKPLSDASKDGYKFEKWVDESGNEISEIDTSLVKNRTIKGVFSLAHHTLKFDYNEGQLGGFTHSNREVFEGHAYKFEVADEDEGTEAETAFPAPTRNGYTLSKWCTDKAGTNEVTPNALMGTSDVTIYAIWTRDEYNIDYTFKAKIDGSEVTLSGVTNTNPTTYNVDDGTEGVITFQTPSKDGYTFIGWKDGTNDVTSLNVNAASHKSYVGWFKKTKHKLTFDYNSGSVGTDTESSYDVFEGSKYGKKVTDDVEGTDTAAAFPSPTKQGYSFSKWNTAADGNGTDVTVDTVMGTAPATIYAIYTPDDYTITKKVKFVKDDLTEVSDDMRTLAASSDPTTYNAETDPKQIILSHILTNGRGFNFIGWFDETDARVNPLVLPGVTDLKNIEFTAKYSRNHAKLIFNENY